MVFPGGKQVRNGREECAVKKSAGKGGRARVMGAISPCQRARKALFKKGTPASARNRHRGWHGAVCAPVHGCFRENHFFDPDPCHWAGVNCYSALDAENRTKATAISRMKTVRMADALLFRLRRAGRMVEGQPCTRVIACSLYGLKVFLRGGGDSEVLLIKDKNFLNLYAVRKKS